MLNIGFFGQSGPYAPVALRRLLELATYQSKWQLKLVVEGCNKLIGKEKHVFFTPKPRRWPAGENLKDLATAASLPVLQTCQVNEPIVAQCLRDHAIDAFVCVGFDRLFAPELIASAPHGALNAHPSRLPQWRGPSPIFWALRHGIRHLGLSIHAIDTHEDHGEIYSQEDFIIPRRATGDDIYRLAGKQAGYMLAQALRLLATQELQGKPQDHALKSRARRPRAEDAMIEPHLWKCEHLVNFATGAPFFITPWMRLGNETFFIKRGLHAEPMRRMPGEFVEMPPYISVQCQDGVAHLELTK
jgi:methionyl-tRNA formyltransferase